MVRLLNAAWLGADPSEESHILVVYSGTRKIRIGLFRNLNKNPISQCKKICTIQNPTKSQRNADTLQVRIKRGRLCHLLSLRCLGCQLSGFSASKRPLACLPPRPSLVVILKLGSHPPHWIKTSLIQQPNFLCIETRLF